ncbi:MAG TPA: glycerol-3-phosphate 1-O-acyltransferase PlsB [Steroidobacteraceae bacterium]|jgi:glycerol-3-phosphate O-acyltransferase|nr:glycerol-3-phosphate 1-O-acyltransferase PlsB [Steroidobacteraceae bacterium]
MGWLLRRFFKLWVRASVQPAEAPVALTAPRVPVCYVLERNSIADLAVLGNVAARGGLPYPERRSASLPVEERRSFFDVGRRRRFWDATASRRPPPHLLALVEALRADSVRDALLVPTAVYWGRAPNKEGSWLRLLFAENWALTSRARKFFAVLINGRNVMVEMGEPISLRSLLDAAPAGDQARRVTRVLRGILRRQRAVRIGPDLSHRRTIIARVLRARAVRAVVAAEAREKHDKFRPGLLQARKYAFEIAANYSHAFVQIAEKLLGRVWNRVYDGVKINHAGTLKEVSEGNEVVYVPCHRSHMDYLLMSYIIYHQGYALPHIAAGINLNIPVVGRFLRKGGAFFIRRSFGGNALYTVVFMKYLAAIMARGHSIEYFIEGGRSRTGRLLQPKTGMLSMTVRSFLRDPVRPVVFVPVYFGYERIVEANTYISELSGAPKKKESWLDLLLSLRVLRERFGTVHVNIGEPIKLDALLDQHLPNWRTQRFDDDTRLPAVNALVSDLGLSIMRGINSAAAVTPINLLATTLLASPRGALPESALLRQLDLYLKLLRASPYSARVTVTDATPAEIVLYGESLKILARTAHPLGDVVKMSDASAQLIAYYRNNVLHLFALPSLVACAFIGNSMLQTSDIQRLAWRIYPYVASELFLRWREEELAKVVEGVLAALADQGVLQSNEDRSAWMRPPPDSPGAMQLSMLAQATIQTIERYYLAISLLLKAGSGTMNQKTLEQQCQLAAQRMNMLYGFNSPEFFDRALFENFIDLLRERSVLKAGAGGNLEFDEVLVRVAADAQLVLSEQIRHSILQVTQV